MPDSRLSGKEDSLLSALFFVKNSAVCLIRSSSVKICCYDDCGDFDRSLKKEDNLLSAPYPAKSRAKLRCPNERPDKRWTFSVEDMRQRNPVNAKRCFKKRTVYCPHLCPENARFSLSFADHVRRSEVRNWRNKPCCQGKKTNYLLM